MEKESGKNQMNRNKKLPALRMKENMIKIKNLDMEFLDGQVAICIEAISKMMRGMVKEKCIGLMEQCIQEVGIEAYNMEREQ
jgi:hypothetical protein